MFLVEQQMQQGPQGAVESLPADWMPPSLAAGACVSAAPSAAHSGPAPLTLADFGITSEAERIYNEVEVTKAYYPPPVNAATHSLDMLGMAPCALLNNRASLSECGAAPLVPQRRCRWSR